MVEWLFLNGVDGQRTGLAIDLANECAIMITTASADTHLAVGYLAMVRTEQTFDPSVTHSLKISTFVLSH